ncbi:MAG: TerC family protein [Candidatus Obscuribacterales bacterium]
MDYPLIVWGGFFAAVFAMLALDLGLFHRKAKRESLPAAIAWSVVWVAVSLAFNGVVYYLYGPDKAVEFFTAYVIEKSLSIDNLFVFLAIFSFFGTREEYQHRVLFWGILGAILIRGFFIVSGTALLAYVSWIMYVFGAFLVYKGIALWRASGDEDGKFGDMLIVRKFKQFFPVTDRDHGPRFFAREPDPRTGRLRTVATTLFLVLIVVDFVDVIFAVDSIPAIIGISQDNFILVTSNVMAILGLRALYSVLAAVRRIFRFLQQGMCLVLVFVGAKMLLTDLYHIPTTWSLSVIGALIGGSILISMIFPEQEKKP